MAGSVFTFKFQKILDVKETQQRVLEVELGRIDGLILEQETAETGWRRTGAEAMARMRQARLCADLEANAQETAYLRHCRARAAQARRSANDLRCRREAVRTELVRASQARKVLERYRDKLKAEFLADQEKAQERVYELHSTQKFIKREGAA